MMHGSMNDKFTTSLYPVPGKHTRQWFMWKGSDGPQHQRKINSVCTIVR